MNFVVVLPLLIDFYDSVAIRDVVHLFGMNIFMFLSIFPIFKMGNGFLHFVKEFHMIVVVYLLFFNSTIIHIENACFSIGFEMSFVVVRKYQFVNV